MKNNNVQVHFLGVRGSAPSLEPIYGGGTSCVLVRIAGETIVFDAGTGLLELPHILEPDENQIHLLLSHSHLDHLDGIMLCKSFFDSSKIITIYGASHDGYSVEEQVKHIMSVPLWPVGPEKFSADVKYHPLTTNSFFINNVKIDIINGNHPGGVSLYRLSYGSISIVYATDIEIMESWQSELYKFIDRCSLLICDSQYTDSEYVGKLDFGHSSWSKAIELGLNCNAKNIRLFHHDPYRTDEEILEYSMILKNKAPNCAFARRGEIITL